MVAIRFQNVTMNFRRKADRLLLGQYLKRLVKPVYHEPFHALKDVSFELEAGESLAVVGRNGAGKSTLLSLVAGLAQPSEGKVEVTGRIAAMLELGAGFHPDLTGLENLTLNASLLGLSRKQTEAQADAMIEFSGIGDFIEEPLRTYSSGMVARLAFSVAIHVDPDILIIDEVLAVGDAAFTAKCHEKIREFHRVGKTLLFVSHGAGVVKEVCERGLWLDHGKVMRSGPIAEVLAAYEESQAASA